MGPLDDINDIPAATLGLGGIDPVWDRPYGRKTRLFSTLGLTVLGSLVFLLTKDQPGGLGFSALIVALVVAVPVVAARQLRQHRTARIAMLARLRRLRLARLPRSIRRARSRDA